MRTLRAWIVVLATARAAVAQELTADKLGVLYNLDDPTSRPVAELYAQERKVPAENLHGLRLGAADRVAPEVFAPLRKAALDALPSAVQSLLLVWSHPFAVGCMSVTSAFASGYRADFCPAGCAATPRNPLYDAEDWLPADTVGWWPAMLLPSADPGLARALMERGRAADFTAPPGTVYLVRTQDEHRNVRAPGYRATAGLLEGRLEVRLLTTPVGGEITDALGYFTGAVRVAELPHIHFRPGAVADHLTSFGGVLAGSSQMSVMEWLRQGATASYGTVSEPCNIPAKFSNPEVLLKHYLRGETVLEAYWKSVGMPGQGLIVGEPLARPFGARGR